MANLTITLTDTQEKALEYIAFDPQDFIQNFANVRAKLATKEILDKLYEHCNANSIQLAVGQDSQITQAYDLGVVKTAKELTDAASSKS